MLTVSGVTFSAAMMRSPSFSRLSSSVTITSLPAAMSAMADSTVSNGGRTEAVMENVNGHRLAPYETCQSAGDSGRDEGASQFSATHVAWTFQSLIRAEKK